MKTSITILFLLLTYFANAHIVPVANASGSCNTICEAGCNTVILSGECNTLSCQVYFGGILGGQSNKMCNIKSTSIVGGCNNFVCNGWYSGVFAGHCNLVENHCSVVIGGECNKVLCTYSSAFGLCNTVAGLSSIIASGTCNSINSGVGYSNHNGIFSGCNNSIVRSGEYYAVEYSTILGGGDNCIDSGPGSSDCTRYSSILGGQNNLVCAGVKHGSILGGSGNTLKHNCAAVFGSGITSVCDGGFHTNFLIACDTPSGYSSGYCCGTIFSSTTTSPPMGAVALYIKI